MNNQLIQKVITANNLPCPDFIFENPLLDRNVAKLLSKSLVKTLNLSQQNSKVNNNLRLSILENIRKMCQIEPENHMKVDENMTMLLSEVYAQKLKESSAEVSSDGDGKDLDAFLIRNMKDMNINSSFKPSINPEIVQAFINLNENGVHLNSLFKDVIHWNCMDSKNVHILKNLWSSENLTSEDISVKLKPELEKMLLEICHKLLNDTALSINEEFRSNKSLLNLIKRCSGSANCFQICSSILNYLFIMTNFDPRIQTFVQTFAKYVKQNCVDVSFSILYPIHLSHIVVLLDIIELDQLPTLIKTNYVKETVKYLSKLQTESDSELIMLLSHFPVWFDFYLNTSSQSS